MPTASLLDKLTASLNNTGGIEQLMALLYAGVSASNGLDADGHYVRAEPMVGSCTTYDIKPILGCSANFTGPGNSRRARDTAAAAGSTADRLTGPTVKAIAGRRTGDTPAYGHEQYGRTVLSGLLRLPDRRRAMSSRRRRERSLR